MRSKGEAPRIPKVRNPSEMTDAHINEYRSKRPIYEALCKGVGTIIENSFVQSNIRCHSIDARAKKVDSFERKVKKTGEDGLPKYTDPMREITDLAGVRVIVYTIDDIDIVTEFIDKSFSILEKRDVGEERVEKGQFGYQSIHYLIKLTDERLALPDYSAYKNFICEIQVRTVLQHAWAEMEHDIQYQGSKNIPKSVKRKFLSLAGLLEIADREFSSIQREDRELKKDVLTDLQKDLARDTIIKFGERKAGSDSTFNEVEPNSGPQVRTLLAAGKYKEAIEAYNTKIELEPKDFTLFIGRARAHFLMGQTDLALRDLDKADELQPDNHFTAALRSKITDGSLSVPKVFQQSDANLGIRKGDDALAKGHPEEAFILYSDAQSAGASWPFTTFKMALAGAVAGDVTGADLLLNELRINSGTPMEINISALRAILSALQDYEDLSMQVDQLKTLVDDKGDFNFEQSPLALLEKLDGEKFWGSHSAEITQILGAMK